LISVDITRTIFQTHLRLIVLLHFYFWILESEHVEICLFITKEEEEEEEEEEEKRLN